MYEKKLVRETTPSAGNGSQRAEWKFLNCFHPARYGEGKRGANPFRMVSQDKATDGSGCGVRGRRSRKTEEPEWDECPKCGAKRLILCQEKRGGASVMAFLWSGISVALSMDWCFAEIRVSFLRNGMNEREREQPLLRVSTVVGCHNLQLFIWWLVRDRE